MRGELSDAEGGKCEGSARGRNRQGRAGAASRVWPVSSLSRDLSLSDHQLKGIMAGPMRMRVLLLSHAVCMSDCELQQKSLRTRRYRHEGREDHTSDRRVVHCCS